MPKIPKIFQSAVSRKPRGGRRENAGRKQLNTPAKKKNRDAKKLRRTLNRERVRAKYDEVIQQVSALRQRGLEDTDEFRALQANQRALSRWLNTATAPRSHQHQGHPEAIPDDATIAAILEPPGSSEDEVNSTAAFYLFSHSICFRNLFFEIIYEV